MSCYEWEEGTIKIPSTEWASFKKRFREHYNAKMEKFHRNVIHFYEKLLAAGKGKRNFDFKQAIWDINSGFNDSELYLITEAMFPHHKDNKKPLKPQKKYFAQVNGSQTKFSGDDCGASFDNKERLVHWGVAENNRACDRAHETILGQAVFYALRHVKWGRNSGGTIVGNDEYNRDDHGEGGGGNFVKQRFGPLGKAR